MAAPAAVLSILVSANTAPAVRGLVRVQSSLEATDKQASRTEKNTSQAFEKMRRSADKAAGAFETVFKGLAIGGAAGAAAGLAYSVKKAADFEQQLSSLGSVADTTGRQMGQLRKQALNAGAATKFSALEAAQAQTELAKGGLSVRQILKGGLKSALALAAAGEMDLADAASTTVNAMKLFGLRGKDSMKVADGLAKAANATTADVKDFALAMQQGGSAAKTSGLSFQETTAWLETLAEAGIKGSDAGTSLKTALIQLASPSSAKAKDLAKELGVNVFDASGKMKSLVDVSANLQKSFGGLTREQRIQAATTLVGQDGFRALLALYDAGPKKVKRLQKGLEEQGTAAEVAKRKQDNLSGSVEQLQGSVETLGIQIGEKLLPFLRRAADEATDFVNKVGRIVNRDDLSLGEKLQAVFDLAKVTVKPWVDKLRVAIERADIPGKLADVVSAATPRILQGFALGGVAAAKTFAGAFADSNVWGKLALGTFLIRKLGLGGLLTGGFKGAGGGALGTAASMSKPVPVFVVNQGIPGGGGGAPVPVPGGGGGGGIGRVKGLLKGAGRFGAGLAALDVAINLVDSHGNPIAAVINTAHDLTFGIIPKVHVVTQQEVIDKQFRDLQQKLDSLTKKRDIGGLAGLSDKIKAMADEARDFGRADLGKNFDALADKAAATATKMQQSQQKVSGMSDRFAAAIRGLRLKGNDDFDRLVNHVTSGSKRIRDVGGLNAKETREAISRQFRIARNRVKEAMHDKVISVKEGTEKIHDLAVKELALYGIKAGKVNVVLAGSKSGNSGQMRPHQRGGHISEGAPVGDSVPALLEKDEYVLNRRAVKKVGRRALDRLNFGTAPRFQQGGSVGGGIVELLDPFNDPKGHGGSNSHLHIAMLAVDRLVALGHRLQSMGWLVSENPAFGGVHAVHAPNSYHYKGQAIDVNWPDAGQELGKIRALLPMLGGMNAGAPKIDRVLATGPDSPMKMLVQAALDRVRGAAQSRLGDVVGAGFEGAETSAGGQFGKSALRRLWVGAGGDPKIANLMAAVALAESGGNARAHNPSGASGLWQILGVPFPGDPFDPQTNARMAVSKYNSQGLGAWEAYTNGNYRQYLQRGGMVGMLKGGGIGRALDKVAHGRNGKVRNSAITKLLGSIDKIDLPEDLKKDLKRLGVNANTYADWADRAAALTITKEDGSQILGKVGGKTQEEWLGFQLTALFEWRNRIIDAEKIAEQKRAEVSALIENARGRLAELRSQIQAAARYRKKLVGRVGNINERIKKLRKHPKKNRLKIAELIAKRAGVQSEIRGVDGMQKARGRARDALTGKILPALKDQRSNLVGARGDLLTNLEEVQGIGSPMNWLKTLPAVGVLGGRIFDVQMQLRDIAADKSKVTDSGESEGQTRTRETLESLLRDANLRTAVSQAQYDVFKNAPKFHTGGIAPGAATQDVPAVLKGGEGVFTREQMAALGGGGPVSVKVVVVEGERVDVFVNEKKIEAMVEKVTRRQARVGSRGLPGRGGG